MSDEQYEDLADNAMPTEEYPIVHMHPAVKPSQFTTNATQECLRGIEGGCTDDLCANCEMTHSLMMWNAIN